MSMEVDMKTTIFADRRGRGNAFDVVRQSGFGKARYGGAGFVSAVGVRYGKAWSGPFRQSR